MGGWDGHARTGRKWMDGADVDRQDGRGWAWMDGRGRGQTEQACQDRMWMGGRDADKRDVCGRTG